MKKFLVLVALSSFILFSSCGDNKKENKPEKITIQSKTEVKKETPANASTKSDDTALIAKGKKLFKDKTCFTCHMPNEKGIGPSITDVSKIYKEQNADIIAFLREKSGPIVDTDPGQVAIMKANLDGFVKDLKDDEVYALKAYMMSVK